MPRQRPSVSLHWMIEDVATDAPRVTHLLLKEMGPMPCWPSVGDLLSVPPGINRAEVVGTLAGRVTDILWSADLDEVQVWASAERRDVTDDQLDEAGRHEWLSGGTAVSGEGADDC